MKSISLLLFFLFQSLYAAEEFIYLMRGITVYWNNAGIYSKLDGKQTVSTNGEVTNFVFCGDFGNAVRDGTCTYSYQYCNERHSPPSQLSGQGSTPATLISTKNSTYKCYSVSNSIPDFVNVMNLPHNYCLTRYQIWYSCNENKLPETPFIPDIKSVVIWLAVSSLFVGFFTFIIGQKRGSFNAIGNPAAAYESSVGKTA